MFFIVLLIIGILIFISYCIKEYKEMIDYNRMVLKRLDEVKKIKEEHQDYSIDCNCRAVLMAAKKAVKETYIPEDCKKK